MSYFLKSFLITICVGIFINEAFADGYGKKKDDGVDIDIYNKQHQQQYQDQHQKQNQNQNQYNDQYLNNDITGDDTKYSNYNFTLPEVSTDGYGDGVYCDKPTFGGGLFGDSNNVGAFVGVSFSLGGDKCDELADMKIIEQEMRMIEMCNRVHQTNWVVENSRVHKVCDRYIPTHAHPPTKQTVGDKKRVSPH